MTTDTTRSELVARRGELMAELFLEELGPVFVSRPTSDVGYDLLAGFTNDSGGINILAVEVKATDRPPGSRYPVKRSLFTRMAHSNVPGLLLVADVKQNRLYYAWLRPSDREGQRHAISVRLVEVEEDTKKDLQRELTASDWAVAAVG